MACSVNIIFASYGGRHRPPYSSVRPTPDTPSETISVETARVPSFLFLFPETAGNEPDSSTPQIRLSFRPRNSRFMTTGTLVQYSISGDLLCSKCPKQCYLPTLDKA